MSFFTTESKIVQKAKQECSDIEKGVFHSTKKAITLHEITGVGRLEEFVDEAQFSCSTAFSL